MLRGGLQSSEFSDVQTPQCIIVGPTRELVLQIRDQARKFSYGTMLRPVVVYGGTSVQFQLRDVFKGTHICIGTPGRLLDFIEKGKVKQFFHKTYSSL
jgi:probable ATP-dependent RNA helicase DDX4